MFYQPSKVVSMLLSNPDNGEILSPAENDTVLQTVLAEAVYPDTYAGNGT